MDKCFQILTKTGNGLLYFIIALAVLAFAPAAFPGFLLAALIAFAIGLVAHTQIKRCVRRLRPYELLPKIRVDFTPLERFSFPSGHTTHAFLMATLLAGFFPVLLAPVVIWAILIGISRIYLGVHYLSDVLAGALLGTICGFVGLSIGY
jgi:undecaprenyl-diphosphatase